MAQNPGELYASPVFIPAATPGTVTSRLYSPDGAALYYNGSPLATGSSVSGTTGKLSKFTAPTTLGDSLLAESGSTVSMTGTFNATSLGGTLTTAAQTAITSVGTLTGGATGAGFTIAIGTSTVTGNIPSANVTGSYTGITGVGTLTAGATGAGFTIALSTSNVTGTLSATRGGTNLDTSGSTGVAQVAAGTWSVTTTLQNAVQDNITRLGTVTTGSFPAANLTGTTLASNVVTSSITTVGTITTGVWNAGTVTSSGAITAGGSIIIPSTSKVRLDGSASGDTYVWEPSANNIGLVAGGISYNYDSIGNISVSANSNSAVRFGGENTSTGTTARTGGIWQNSAGSFEMGITSTGFTATGVFPQNGAYCYTDRAGGMTIAVTSASGSMRLWSGNALALTLDTAQAATFVGQALLPNGTNSNPALTFSADTDTGIYRSASNELSLALGGAQVFTFRGQAVSPAITMISSGTPNGVISFSGGTGSASSFAAGDNAMTINTGTFTIGGTPKFTIDGTGAGSALLGSNSPASTLTAPYTWLTIKSSDGSTVYVPAWK